MMRLTKYSKKVTMLICEESNNRQNSIESMKELKNLHLR